MWRFPSKLLIFIVVFSAWAAPASWAQSPEAVVSNFQQQLLATMKVAKGLSVKERYQRLEPSVVKAFHLPLMTRIATGGYWKSATQDQKKSLISGFRKMSVSTLATLFKNYKGESFKNYGAKPGPRNLQVVRTEMQRPNKKPVQIIYISKNFRDRWYLIDVIVDDGISELKVRRSEYNGILKQKGITGLIEALNKKADELINAKP